ncbi:methyltransferase domain-containing protein [Wukongibacter sp. M2B1]|uniref:methyltransferase domain-containing protein n=1 Tax=Wukongibacter sp. M2B1 TaxID=3088895 RepID=UPI003D7A408A
MHQSSYKLMENFVKKYLKEYEGKKIDILDIGSKNVNGTYKLLFDDPSWNYYGSDIVPGNNVDIVLEEPYNWKNVESDLYDVVISGQAFEHIEYFWITILEIARVTKKGGIICIIAPSKVAEHRHPVDCWRFYRDGFEALAKYSGLTLLEAYTVKNPNPINDSVLICKKKSLDKEEEKLLNYKNKLSKLIINNEKLLQYQDYLENLEI